MAGDILSIENDEQSGEPLIQPVMRDGRRVAPSPTLAEIRARAAADLARLPEPLRRLEPDGVFGTDGERTDATRDRRRQPPGAA